MQNKRMQKETIQIKPTLNVKIALPLFWTYFQKMELYLSGWVAFLISKRGGVHMRKYE